MVGESSKAQGVDGSAAAELRDSSCSSVPLLIVDAGKLSIV